MNIINNSFVTELSKLRPNSTFLTLKGYRNAYSEVSDYNIIFNVNYSNSLEKSIEILNNYMPDSLLEIKAKQELIDSFKKSLNKMDSILFEELDDNYYHFKDEDDNYIKGVKCHIKTGILHLYGFVVHKKIIIPGNYPKTNKQELSIVKDKLRKLCPTTKFRQFRIIPDQLDYIRVDKITLLPE